MPLFTKSYAQLRDNTTQNHNEEIMSSQNREMKLHIFLYRKSNTFSSWNTHYTLGSTYQESFAIFWSYMIMLHTQI